MNFSADLGLENRSYSFDTQDFGATISGAINGIGPVNNSELHKQGTGTLTITSSGSYAGSIVVDEGILRLNNSSGSAVGTAPITVNTGATLGGTGFTAGPVTVNGGGMLAPGASIESLSTGSLDLSDPTAMLELEFDLDATPDADLLEVTGTAMLGGELQLSFENAPTIPPSPTTFLVVQNDGTEPITGTFDSIIGLPVDYEVTLDYSFSGTDALGRVGTGNDLAITVSAVPEASPDRLRFAASRRHRSGP